MASDTSRWAVYVPPGAVNHGEDYTLVQSKKERRRQRKGSEGTQDLTKNSHPPSVELLRCAPDGGARTRAPPQASSAVGNDSVEKPVELAVHAPGGYTERTREHEDVEEEDPKRRKDAARPNEDQDPDTDPIGTYAEWRLTATGESLSTRYLAVKWLESVQKLDFRVRVSSSGEFFVRAKSWKTACALSDLSCEKPEGIVLEKCGTEARGVVLGYPVHLPLDPILDHPSVQNAERCFFGAGRGRRLPTRSVRVTFRGQLPSLLDLGCWGRFDCRRFVPEPLRCFRCQAFGHHQRHCSRPTDLCGRCSGEHSTRDCRLHLREGEDAPLPRCPNCNSAHNAWHRRCPERLRRIPGAARPPKDTLERTPRPQQAAAGACGSQGTERPEDGQRRRRHRRRRGKKRTERQPPTCTPGPRKTEAKYPRLEVKAKPRTKVIVTVAPQTSVATQTEDLRCNQMTQTGRCYVYSEAGLADLLIQYEHLLAQEREAQRSRTPHEPALHCVRRHVRGGERVPHKLPMEVPITPPVQFRHHCHETDWLAYGQEEEKKQEEEEESPEEEEIDPAAVEDDSTTPPSLWVRVLPKGVKIVPCSPANNSRGPGNRPSCKRDST